MDTIADLLTRANQCHHAGRWADAVKLYTEALTEVADNAELWYLLGTAQAGLGQMTAATKSLQAAVRLSPDTVEFHRVLGALMNHLGQYDLAGESFSRALNLDPQGPLSAGLRSAIAGSQTQSAARLAQQGRGDEAIARFRAALRLDDNLAQAWDGLGTALRHAGALDESAECFDRWIALEPRRAAAYVGLSLTRRRQNRIDQALAACRSACELEPEYIDAHVNLGITLLLAGQYDEGWREYEWRLKNSRPARRGEPARWAGEPLAGRSILIRGEQGFGDNLQFVRFAQEFKERQARVIVSCKRPLGELLSRAAGVDQVVVEGEELPPVDTYIEMLSLPGMLAASEGQLRAKVPYVRPDATLVGRWREELCGHAARPLTIGIAWQGSPTQVADRRRSFPLASFAEIARLPEVQLVSLQFGAGREQIAEFASAWPLWDLGDRLGDFHNTAAIMSNLDLVITCDTSAAHLAGALARPVWVLLPFAPDWRWMLAREDSPWYPTMRLFRQSQADDWREVFAKVMQSLTMLNQERRAAAVKI